MPHISYRFIIVIILVVASLTFIYFLFFDNQPERFSSQLDKETCSLLTDKTKQMYCWQSLLESTLNSKGLEEGFILFRELAELNPDACHDYGHDLGRYAYGAHKSGDKIILGEEAAYCEYGFWHGFTETMMADSGFQEARKFCESTKGSNSQLELVIQNNCFHGVGIGLIPHPPPLKLWGETQALLEPALGYCDATGNLRESCYSGVFHALVNFMIVEEYSFFFKPDDPFEMCFAQKEKYRGQCYFQVAPKLAALTKNNMAKALEFLKQIPDLHNREYTAVLAFMTLINTETLTGHLDFIKECRVSDVGPRPCLVAAVNNLFSRGTAEGAYVQAMELCGQVKEQDKKICYENIVTSASRFFSQERVGEICGIIERTYAKICD